jgi:hypothetical protein
VNPAKEHRTTVDGKLVRLFSSNVAIKPVGFDGSTLANHESRRTTKLCDGTREILTFEEVEKLKNLKQRVR